MLRPGFNLSPHIQISAVSLFSPAIPFPMAHSSKPQAFPTPFHPRTDSSFRAATRGSERALPFSDSRCGDARKILRASADPMLPPAPVIRTRRPAIAKFLKLSL